MFNADLNIVGVRQAEGGIRSKVYKSCFSPIDKQPWAAYRPIWFMSDADKAAYEAAFDIHHSDCYTVYGLKRTGCVGCPFNSRAQQELQQIEPFEPNLVKAARNIFGVSYAYRARHDEFNDHMKREERERKKQR